MSVFILLIYCSALLSLARCGSEENEARKFIEEAEETLLKDAEIWQFKQWDFQINITDHTEKAKLEYKV